MRASGPAPGPSEPVDARLEDLDELDAPDAVVEHYRSVDSAPIEYSVDRPPRAVNGFLVYFVALSVLVLLVITVLVSLGHVGRNRDLVLFARPGDRAAIPVRVFILIFFVAFSLSLATNLWRRLLVLVQLCGGLLLLALAVDLATVLVNLVPGITIPVAAQQVAAAILGLGLFPVVVLRNALLPDPGPIPQRRGRIAPSAWVRLLVALTLAVVLADVIAQRFEVGVTRLRDLALLGGVGPGVFLVQQLLVLIAGAIGVVLVARSRRTEFSPAVGVLIPAHNEAHGIAETIAALDRAAGVYAGSVHLYVVDNVSIDHTARIAQRAIARTTHLTATMLSCDTPGKAKALNYGLLRITEPFVVRIDADVVIGEDCLALAMRHFTDARVGAVGGVPLPAHEKTFFDRARLVEVLVRHAFFQVARMGYDGIVGVPGMLTAFRRSALDEAGPIQQGMNGEDTDVGMRLNAMGYRSIVEPRARYSTEVPRTWAHMREQRTRWFRSTYHVAGHNRRELLRTRSMAGAVVLPFGLLNAARRAMLLPILLFAVLVLGAFPRTFAGLRWQPVVAMGIGLPALVAIVVCLLLRQPKALLYIPEYLVFRLIRGYFTLAAVLSLRFPPLAAPGRREAPAPAGEAPPRGPGAPRQGPPDDRAPPPTGG
ncbi:glycosyltransferase [Cellulomonas chengniuliangii]|uniref:Glycosyltransferase n=1 Tax=Cellulomonas chengniuliangii TaxID=2968084 RepID=A0ABY5KVC5_9CELL|nr:glycosyltransferase [Cellulomonas chengniuliangii]MCC2308851.1 glycosyltransferase [Cellulomonas chengniuliangii]MCC2317086.1 glycosyltransferase [Cellulomonas chengniuliangii]UUI74405.1 glycosyltransferase [Cellulomonas chengniuliangii]